MIFIPSANGLTIPPGPAHINITSHLNSIQFKNGNRVVTSLLYNFNKTSRSIGNSVLICENISNKTTLRKGTESCVGIYRFPLGYIVAQGIITSRIYFRLAVVGGTGIYSTVSGQLQNTAIQLNPRKDKVDFRLIIGS